MIIIVSTQKPSLVKQKGASGEYITISWSIQKKDLLVYFSRKKMKKFKTAELNFPTKGLT